MTLFMASQFGLLTTRRFLPMFLTQFFGALNDNVFKQSLLLVFTYQFIATSTYATSTLNNLAALLFILPYFLFSATAGQLADHYEKARLTRWLKAAEIIIMLLATIGFLTRQLWLLLFALFLMGTHSTFFGPIKYAILPQTLYKDELMAGNALFQTGTSLAILFGMILGGVIMAHSHGNLLWVSLTVLFIAVAGYICAQFILAQPISAPDLRINWNFLATSIETLKYSWQIPSVFYAIIGISWFWFYGATYLTQIPQLAQQVLHAGETVVSLLLTLFSIGVGIGSLLCRRLSGAQVSLKLVPFGAIGLSLFAIDLFFAMQALPTVSGALLGIEQIVSQLTYWRVMFDIVMLGLSGGFYIVPLYAYMQAQSPETHRARIIAANNILNALFMVVSAVISIMVLSILELSLASLFLATAVLSALVSFFVLNRLRQLPDSSKHPNI
ncbi:MFS transporter [Alkanindiges sp. WGS2144]|uniref:MFS transporter n=1 Tax=Alkanindiges sp. WGS2144 TaxID=3366808 RepID=UPI003750C2A7